ncbi:M3 family oligoendopeptidase [Lapidilactobacillus mulanensis]|uniref:M3 family oligoendopeptidase n=1 Tax=Lapidilactobacillus mulanensis TaxID=2485999 RepID=A0ABW4DL05_9LACO|nr:M3 family oligoendopeptidase [Lapidilactobacillus mulanensis]
MADFAELTYQRPNYESIKSEYDQLLAALNGADDPLTATQAALAISKLNEQFSSQQMLSMIRHSVNTLDAFYEGENDYWDENEPKYDELTAKYYQALISSPFQEALHRVLPAPLFKIAANQVKTFSSENIPLMQRENKLISRYSKLIASAQIEFNGETYTLPQLGKFSSDPDRQLRKAASLAVAKWYADHGAEFDDIYDQLVKIRTQIAHQLGYRDYAQMSLDARDRFDYDDQDIANYREQILKQVVPVATEIHERQRQRLGLDKLEFFDEGFTFPSGNAVPEGTSDELVAKANDFYHELSPETGRFFQMMVDDHNLDLLSHHGKESGGYCEYLPAFNTPFIFANFNGTSGDVDVLTHETGHAFQAYQARDTNAWECIFPTTEAAEIFSMSMEFIAYPWIDKFFGKQTAKYEYDHLSSALIFLPYGALVDHFQTEVYTHPELTPKQRKATWRRLERLYLPDRDYTEVPELEEGIFWYRQGHIFEVPFYYIDYTLAQVVAFEFWQRFNIDRDPQAWSDYLAMAQAGGKKSFIELIELGHLQSPFAEGTIEHVVEQIKTKLAATSEADLQ